jgi:DNA invertase Pin-like site-specific DNA recombinase
MSAMRVLIAARLSRKARKGENIEFPIEAQDLRAREWALAEGHEVVDAAADYKSGTVPPWKRKNLRKWVTDPARMARYDAIVAHKTDRISRGTDGDFSLIEAWAVENGKRIIIVGPDGGIQYPSRTDSDFWQWTATKRQARKEWEDIRSRTMNRSADLISRGKLVGRPPWGYVPSGTKYDKTMVPTDEGRKYVPAIFKRIADGETLRQVCRWLDSEGVETPTSVTDLWGQTTLGNIIRCRTYAGQRQTADGLTILEVEPLVDAALWLCANKRLDSGKRGHRGPKEGPPSLLTGSLRCGKCGGRMFRSKYVYYRCYGHHPINHGCGTLVRVQLLDAIVDESMRMNRVPALETKFIPGKNHDAEIA